MQGTKYLGEIIKEEGIELGSNTLIVAPVGSGKTYYILNDLCTKDKNSLYLCDTTNLKNSILKENDIGVTYTVIGIILHVPKKFKTTGILIPNKINIDCLENKP